MSFVRVVAVVVVSAAVASLSGTARADSSELDRARAEVSASREREQVLAAEIELESGRIDDVEAELATLAGEVRRLETQLGRARARVERLDRELEWKTRQLRLTRAQQAAAQRQLQERLVALYTSEQPELVELVMGAEDLADFVDGLEARDRVAQADARLVEQMRELRLRVTRQRARTAALRRRRVAEAEAIAARTERRRSAYEGLVSRRASLVALRDERSRTLNAVRVDRKQWEAQAAALAAESARIAAVAAQAPPPAAIPAPTAAASSGYAWPVRGSIVSPFGLRWGKLHAGIDIAAPAGTPVTASATGTVAYAGAMSGYGLIVVIQHSGGVSTAYAHNSSISVSVGQQVAQGQTIAAVGCTGHCFGDHVHFEVRVNGSPVDPMGYL